MVVVQLELRLERLLDVQLTDHHELRIGLDPLEEQQHFLPSHQFVVHGLLQGRQNEVVAIQERHFGKDIRDLRQQSPDAWFPLELHAHENGSHNIVV